MNQQEHLLVCMMEECTEIAQACAKALRFGLDDHHPEKQISNATDIRIEFCQLWAVAGMLEEHHLVRLRPNFASNADMRTIAEKVARVEKWLQYSRERGILKG